MYPNFAKVAKKEGFIAIKAFKNIAEVEKKHGERFKYADMIEKILYTIGRRDNLDVQIHIYI